MLHQGNAKCGASSVRQAGNVLQLVAATNLEGLQTELSATYINAQTCWPQFNTRSRTQ